MNDINDNDEDNDLYFTDERQSERLIAENEINMSNETIANRAFNKGFFTTCSLNNQDKYDEGFESGKKYSIEFGKLLGLIDAFLFYYQEIHHDEKIVKPIDSFDLNRIKEVKVFLEQYKEEMDQDFIEEKKNELKVIIDKYL